MLINKITYIPDKANIVNIFGVPVTLCSLEEGISIIEKMILYRKPQLVVIANAHTLNLAHEQNHFRNVLKTAGLILRDGTGVSWAVNKRGGLPLHNFVGTDFVPEFCRKTAAKGYRFFLLGSKPGVAQKAAEKLKILVPKISIAGHHHGYLFDDKNEEIINRINETRTDVLLVAMGNPKQELWLANNLHRLTVPVNIGVGALFDNLSGRVTRAPRWMINAGLEWLYRLLAEPKRLWKRYLIGNLKFIIRVYREKIKIQSI